MKTTMRMPTVVVLALLASPGMLAAADEAGGGLFDINPGLSVWATAILLGLLGILWKFAWGPILGAVEAREQRIQGALDESAQARDEAAKLLEEHKAQLADARRQASEIIAEGKAAGEKVRRDIEEKARGEGQAIVEAARREVQREKEQAIAELRQESVDLAIAAASKLMSERLDDARDRELVMDYLKGLGPDQGAQA
jgi:F-type H+-transporting ATPase subunit b